MKYQLRKQSAAEVEKLKREKNDRNKRKEDTSKSSPETSCFVNKTTLKIEQQVTPPIQILVLAYHNRVNQAVVKRKKLEFVSVGEKLMLRL